MRLLYLANQRLPTEKAYGLQISKMCSNFSSSKNIDLELVFPYRHNEIKDSFFDYYNIKKSFKISKIKSPDFYLPGSLEVVAFGVKNLISALILAGAVLARNPDIIYSRDELPLYILSFFRKNLFFESHKMQNTRLFMYKRFKRRKVKVITITNALREEFIKIGFMPENILVASDGVDAEVINREETNPTDKKMARKALDLPLDKKLAVYTGSLYAWKGVYVLANAAKLMPDTIFIVVGGDKRGDETGFRHYLSENKIDNVRVTGHIVNEEIVRNYLSAADVLILPNSAKDRVSEKFTSPLKLFSYMAARRPIVASDLSSIREILNDCNSVLFEADNPISLVSAIEKIFNDRDLIAKISEQAFSDVKEYTWEDRAKNILNFIQK